MLSEPRLGQSGVEIAAAHGDLGERLVRPLRIRLQGQPGVGLGGVERAAVEEHARQ